MTSVASNSSIRTSIFGKKRDKSSAGNLNRFGYNELDIRFQSREDRREFVKIWGRFVRPLGVREREGG